jgi:hypothetical protein
MAKRINTVAASVTTNIIRSRCFNIAKIMDLQLTCHDRNRAEI